MAGPHTVVRNIAGVLPRVAAGVGHDRLDQFAPSRLVQYRPIAAAAAHLLATRLDRVLASGIDPVGDVLLERRALQLTSRRTRRGLADAIDAHLAEADRARATHRTTAIPASRREVRYAAPSLRQLAARLRDPAAPRPQAIAQTRLLLIDGHGPLYGTGPFGAVDQAVRVAIARLDDSRAEMHDA